MSKEKRNFTTRVKYVREKGNELGEKGVQKFNNQSRTVLLKSVEGTDRYYQRWEVEKDRKI